MLVTQEREAELDGRAERQRRNLALLRMDGAITRLMDNQDRERFVQWAVWPESTG